MMTAQSLLKKLTARPPADETLELLRALSTAQYSAKSLLAYHDQLLFYKAYPVSEAVRRFADRELSHFHARITPELAEELAQTGIAGTMLYYAFDFGNAQVLSSRLKDLVDLDWEDYESRESDPLAGLLWLLLESVEADAADSETLTVRTILQRVAGERTTLSLLLERFRHAFPEQVADHLYNEASLMLAMTLDPKGPSRTLTAEPRPKNLWIWSQEKFTFDFAAEIRKPLELPQPVPRRRGQELLNLVHGTLTVRLREYYGATHGNPEELYEIQLERGASLLVWFNQLEWRLPQEAGWGFLMLKNGVPISYGGGGMHPARLEIALNIFDTFRGGEAGWVYASLIRVARTFCPAPWVIARRYQIGYENDEAVGSGAYWFYDKLGLRSTDAKLRRIADAERRKITRIKGYRTPKKTLKQLAEADVVIGLNEQDPALYREYPLDSVSLLASLALTTFAPRDSGLEKRVLGVVEERLGFALPGMTTSERKWVAQHGSLLLALPDSESWSSQQKQTWLAMARGKGGPREAEYLRHACALNGYFDALEREALKLR